ncbi:MAG: tetratricopeptide repeat protein [Nitrospirae bacterium]|nr:tetratricopeptide repeat protein [Nitrospirota bacterium]
MRFHCKAYLLAFLLCLSFTAVDAAEEHDIFLAQGIQRIAEERISDALALLQKALKVSPEDPEIIYYAGVAYSRAGRYSEAESLFLKNLSSGNSSPEVYLELVRVYSLTAQCQKAESTAAAYRDHAPDEEFSRYISKLLEACKNKTEKKNYQLTAITGLQYDSNVTVEPSNPPSGNKRHSDTRAIFYLHASATPLKSDSVSLNIEYSLYQSLHGHLKDFNILFQRLGPSVSVAVSSTIIAELGHRLEYTLFGGEQYSSTNALFGKVLIKESDTASTEGLYEYKWHKYWDSALFETNSVRTGHQSTISLKQNISLAPLSGSIFLAGDFDRTEQRYWDYNGYRTGAELLYGISDFFLRLTGEYSEKHYRGEYPSYQEKRTDHMQVYSLGGTYMIRKHLGLTVSDSYTRNRSNLGVFDYKRNMVSILFIVGVL